VENVGVLLASIFAVALLVALGWFLRYQQRLSAVTETLIDAEEALDRGEIEVARRLTAPLLAAYPSLAVVQEVAADVLYAGGDPLSAASLWERALKKLGAPRVAPRLVAAYTALNRPGDARRVAALVPGDGLARVTLAWCELAAVGGDRERGRALADGISRDDAVRATASGDAMASALAAIAAAHAGDAARMRAALDEAERRSSELAAHDRAFIGYLGGVALREAGAPDDARATWTMAMDAAPESIGAALARRERSHLPAP
jgi:tetratricopeptide (TPR) repeat protein